MKKLLCLLCAILIISSLVACNSNEENNSSYGIETNVSHQEQLTENSTEKGNYEEWKEFAEKYKIDIVQYNEVFMV